MAFASYQVATRCTGSASAGSRALMKWAMLAGLTDVNMGIYSCRPIRGGGARSLHSEGRAGDHGVKSLAKGHRLVQTLRPHARALGIQCMIFDRRIWSAKSPGRNGRAYRGVNPHYDHVHIELTRNAAGRLTLATLRSVLEGKSVKVSAPAPTKPKRSTGRKRPVKVGSRTLREGSRGRDVVFVQRFLGIRADGIYGRRTRARVRWYQDMRGLKVDGVVGPRTWAHMLGRVKR